MDSWLPWAAVSYRPLVAAASARDQSVGARSLDIEALAEGIETQTQTQTQARALALFGCDYGQGYFSSVPLPADAMTSLIGRQ
jgi:EAL domain-containing protein (putative c-di-GMP-specific phosphodiesterase class I)